MDKKEKNPINQRVIDRDIRNTYLWWGSAFVAIKKSRVKTWQGVFILAFVAGTVSTLIMNVSMNIQSMSEANGETAILSLNPSAISVNKEETFDVDVILNTNNNNIVATRAIINYNINNFTLTGWDTSDSVFSAENTCTYDNKPCEIVNNDTANGTISVTLAKPSPGVNTASGVIVSLTFQATANAQTDGITLSFNSRGDYTDSDVIFDGISDDGIGTDILSGVIDTTVVINSPDTTPPALTEVTSVSTPTSDTTPNYTFSSTEAGAITYGGSCNSSTTQATIGNNAITFSILSDGTYSNCTITVTDASNNASSALSITSFVVDTATGANRSDVDGSGTVSTADAQLTLRKSVGLDMGQTAWVNATYTGDVNCDDAVSTADALLLLRNSVGLDMSQTSWCAN